MVAVRRPRTGMRLMSEDDVPVVMAIEKAEYEFGWTEGIFRDCLRVGYLGLVYVIEDRVVGYGVASVRAGECHILNLCVSSDYTRRGIARALLRRMLRLAAKLRAESAWLEVRPTNFVAIGLYQSEGFSKVGSRRDYYPARIGREDALLFSRALEDFRVRAS